MTPLDRRLRRLEGVSDSGACSVCGFGADGVPPGGNPPCGAYEVVWDDAEEAGEGGPERCGACGRQTATAIVWADLEEREPGGGRSLMARCGGAKRDGSRCTTIVRPPQTYCYQHDPARSEERRRNASKAARTKPNGEVRRLKGDLKNLIAGVLSGAVGKGEAAVAIQGHNALTRMIELERKVKEAEELEERIERLEEQATEKGGRRWGSPGA